MQRRMIPLPAKKPGQIINPQRQKKKHLIKTLGLKTGKAYRRFVKAERRKAQAINSVIPVEAGIQA